MIAFVFDNRWQHSYTGQWVDLVLEIAAATKERSMPLGVFSLEQDCVISHLAVGTHKQNVVLATLANSAALAGQREPCADLAAALELVERQLLRCMRSSPALLVLLAPEGLLSRVQKQLAALESRLERADSRLQVWLVVCKDGVLSEEETAALEDATHFSFRTDNFFVHQCSDQELLFRDPHRPLASLGLDSWARQTLATISDVEVVVSVEQSSFGGVIRPGLLHLPPELARHWAALSRSSPSLRVLQLLQSNAAGLSQHLLGGIPLLLSAGGTSEVTDFVVHCRTVKALVVFEASFNPVTLSRGQGSAKHHLLGTASTVANQAVFLLQGLLPHDSIAPVPLSLVTEDPRTDMLFGRLPISQSFHLVDYKPHVNSKPCKPKRVRFDVPAAEDAKPVFPITPRKRTRFTQVSRMIFSQEDIDMLARPENQLRPIPTNENTNSGWQEKASGRADRDRRRSKPY